MAKYKTYTVKSGDSYAKIAGQIYGDQRWMSALAGANQDRMLHPGMEIRIPMFDTEKTPVITQARAETLATAPQFYQEPEAQRQAITDILARGAEMGWETGRGVVGAPQVLAGEPFGEVAPAALREPAKPETFQDIIEQYSPEHAVSPYVNLMEILSNIPGVEDFGAAFQAQYAQPEPTQYNIQDFLARERAYVPPTETEQWIQRMQPPPTIEEPTQTFREIAEAQREGLPYGGPMAPGGVQPPRLPEEEVPYAGPYLAQLAGGVEGVTTTERMRSDYDPTRIYGDITAGITAEGMTPEQVDLIATTEARLFQAGLYVFSEVNQDPQALPQNISHAGAMLIPPETLEREGYDFALGETDKFMMDLGYSWMGGFWTREPFGTTDYSTAIGGYTGDGQYTPDRYWQSYVTGRGTPSGRGAGGGFGSEYTGRVSGFGLVNWRVGFG